MANQKKGSEIIAVLENIPAQDLTTATYNSTTWVKADKFQRYMGVFNGGALAASAVLDFSLVQATTSTGTSSKAIANCTATQLGAADDNKQIIINCTVADLDLANSFDFIGLEITTVATAALGAAILYGLYPFDGPASDNDHADVDEIVN